MPRDRSVESARVFECWVGHVTLFLLVCGAVEVASLMISWTADTAINTTFTMTSPLADVVHSLYGSYSQATCLLWTYHQDNHIDSCRPLLLLTFRMHAKTVVTSFTFALVSSVTVSTSHVRTLPQGPLSLKAKRCFHISHHIGLHRISTLHTRPTLEAEQVTAHFCCSTRYSLYFLYS